MSPMHGHGGEDMRIGTCEIQTSGRSIIGDLTAVPDTVWTRLGNEVLIAGRVPGYCG
jgi:hypothetical protein